MKKYLLVFLFAIFIIPSIAFASWWNPFSWNWFGLFNNTRTTTQTPLNNPIQLPPTNPPKICPAWGCEGVPIKPITDTSVTRKVGDREFNFLIQKINTNTINGLLYILYPVAMLQGQPKTLNIGDTVGYTCEGKIATLVSINIVNQTAIFNEVFTTTPRGGCPI